MTSLDIWYKTFDVGSKKGGFDKLSPIQQRLYTFIDFHISIEMDGAYGFLYNRNFEDPDDSLYVPYIDNLRLFHYDHLANLLQQFNDGYMKGLQNEIKTNGTWEGQLKAYGLTRLVKQIEKEANKILGAKEVRNWIDQHYDELAVGLI